MKKLLIIISILLTGFDGLAQRFTGVQWKVHTKPGLTNEFAVDMILTRKNGKSLTIHAGDNDFRSKSFRFEYDGLISLDDGLGSFIISNDLSGVDSVVVKAVSEKLELSSEFKVPVLYCKALRLENKTMEYNAKVAQRWTMVMNNGLEAPLDELWFDRKYLRNESDTLLQFAGDSITARMVRPVRSARVHFTHAVTGEPVLSSVLTFTYPLTAEFSFSGVPGRKGRDGAAASASGRTGSNGENGENGYSALPVTVYLRRVQTPDSMSLLEAIAICGSSKKRQLLADNATMISLQAQGGAGGNGGDGGRGGSSEYLQKETGYLLRNAGNGGAGGFGGHGGKGSDIFLIVENTIDAGSLFTMDNSGGLGGQGGAGGAEGASASVATVSGTATVSGESGPAGRAGANGAGGTRAGISYVSPGECAELLKHYGF